MRILWTLLKVIIGLAIAIPLGLFALALTAGLVGTVITFAILAIKLAIVACIGLGLFRLGRALFGSPRKPPAAPPVREISAPTRDPYYEAALRELDAELGIRDRAR